MSRIYLLVLIEVDDRKEMNEDYLQDQYAVPESVWYSPGHLDFDIL